MVAIVESRYKTEKEKFIFFLPLFYLSEVKHFIWTHNFHILIISLILKYSPTFILLMKKKHYNVTYLQSYIYVQFYVTWQ